MGFTVKIIFILLTVCFLQFHCKRYDLPVGFKCSNPDSSEGKCTLVTECKPALEAINSQRRHQFKRCNFQGHTEVVCCPRQTRKSARVCETYSKGLPPRLPFYVADGENAERGDFPHMAALGFYSPADKQYQFICGGTLVSSKHIVTAAHCISNADQKEVRIVRLGEVNVPEAVDLPDPKIDHRISNVIVHKNYGRKMKLNDIAIIELQEDVKFADNIRPACLYTKNDDPDTLTIAGWGITSNGKKATILQQARVKPVTTKECNATYYKRVDQFTVTRDQICATDKRSDTCDGDSGGPLQTQVGGSLASVVGVTSYGNPGCGASKYPGVYTRISSYIDWIEEIVWP